MAIGNVELMHECSHKHYMGTVRLKLDKETDEEGKEKTVNMEVKWAQNK